MQKTCLHSWEQMVSWPTRIKWALCSSHLSKDKGQDRGSRKHHNRGTGNKPQHYKPNTGGDDLRRPEMEITCRGDALASFKVEDPSTEKAGIQTTHQCIKAMYGRTFHTS